MTAQSYRFIAVAMSMLLVACAPVIETIYQPRAEGGKVIGSLCGGKAGPYDVLVFSREKVQFEVQATNIGNDKHIDIRVGMMIPHGVAIKMVSSTIKLWPSDSSNKNEIDGHLVTARGYDVLGHVRDVSPDEPFVGETYELRQGMVNATFVLHYEAALVDDAAFTVLLPQIYINTTILVKLPPIIFTKTNGFWILMLNC